jgi:hypothetical protein
MLHTALFMLAGRRTMLAPDPGYEAWTMEEGLDGATDWHIDDHPFLYTSGWDFPTVNEYFFNCLFSFTL